jgi:pimeloyl-ACP methyl ester carboxylesterase
MSPTCRRNGLRDTATQWALSYELAAGIQVAKLIELAGCGHSSHIQNPEGFWQTISPLLRLTGWT